MSDVTVVNEGFESHRLLLQKRDCSQMVLIAARQRDQPDFENLATVSDGTGWTDFDYFNTLTRLFD